MELEKERVSKVQTKADFSIVIPVYFNEGSLKQTFQIIKDEVFASQKGKKGEVIFVDDGSGDNSFAELVELKEKYPDEIKLIKFTRNFGQYYAKFAGHKIASGDCIVSISADLQDPPELMNEMINAYFDEGYEIVICTRNARNDSFFKNSTSKLFYSIIRRLSFKDMPVGGFDYHLMGKAVRDLIFDKPEKNSYFQGQIFWSGYKIKTIPYERRKREVGTSRWTFFKRLKTLIDAVLAYSYFPLRLMSFLGLIIAILGFGYAMYVLYGRIFFANAPVGFAPLMITILVLSGIQMMMIGIVGEYLWRTLDQVRDRAPFVIEKVID